MTPWGKSWVRPRPYFTITRRSPILRPEVAMTAIVIDGRAVAEEIRAGLRERAAGPVE
jgi:hypothetical protein